MDSLGNHVLDLLETVKVILALDVFRSRHDHSREECSEA